MEPLIWGRIARGPGPSPQNEPSMTANTPGWMSFWMRSRSTRVSWMTECVQCRLKCSSPPKAFFIAPVMVVNTWVFTVGSWMMFLPTRNLGIRMPVFL